MRRRHWSRYAGAKSAGSTSPVARASAIGIPPGSARPATRASTARVTSGRAGPPVEPDSLSPLSGAGLWLAVIVMPAAAR